MIFLVAQKDFVCPKKAPKQTLSSLPTSDMLDIASNSSVTPIWKPLGPGSLLASLRTTFDTWLSPGPLKPPLGAH